MTTYPWFKFYPSDWRGDPLLRRCSLPARGLWIELIGLMHGSAEYGHLDPSLTEQDIAQIVGSPLKNVRRALADLERNRVFDRGEKGEIVSRRMVRDHAKALKDREETGGRGSDPNIMSGVNPEVKAQIPEARIQKDQIPKSSIQRHRHRHDDNDDDGNAKKPSIGSPLSINDTAFEVTNSTSISETAFKLTNIVSALCGYTDGVVPRSWSGAPVRVQGWLDRGWPAELIEEACRQQIVKRRGVAPNTIAYFERGIAELVAWWRPRLCLPYRQRLRRYMDDRSARTSSGSPSATPRLNNFEEASRLTDRKQVMGEASWGQPLTWPARAHQPCRSSG